MSAARSRLIAWVVLPMVLAACQSQVPGGARSSGEPSAPLASSPQRAAVVMPHLVGLPSVEAGRRLGEIETAARLGISSEWRRPITVRCGVRPGSVVRQHPEPGTPLRHGAVVRIRTAALDLAEFRGPCAPAGGDLGPVTGADAVLARRFYRFSADPSLGAPFVRGDVWTGIEDGAAHVSLGRAERADPSAWRVGAAYAESVGPFSALDVTAGSGGYYELRHGVAPTCPSGNGEAPPGLVGLRAISLTAPAETTGACYEWWGVTLFLDEESKIRGVALRLGSP